MKANLQHVHQGSVMITPQSEDDLWVLYQLIDKSDRVKAQTFRKVKIGGENDRSQKVVRKPMTLTLEVQKTEFLASSVRVLGTIVDGPEDISRAEFHSFCIEIDQDITIIKNTWPHFAIEKIKQAISEEASQVLAVVFDRDQATVAKITNHQYSVLTSLRGNMPKKTDANQQSTNFYAEVTKVLQEYVGRGEYKTLVVGSAPFWQPYIKKALESLNPQPKIIFSNVQDASEKGIQEVLRRPELQAAMQSSRFSLEAQLVESFLEALATDKPVAYGVADCKKAIDAGAAKVLLISESFIAKKREQDTMQEVQDLLVSAEQTQCEIHFIGKHESGKKVEGLGGVVASLRYAL